MIISATTLAADPPPFSLFLRNALIRERGGIPRPFMSCLLTDAVSRRALIIHDQVCDAMIQEDEAVVILPLISADQTPKSVFNTACLVKSHCV